jgi:hypothetical protein
MRSASSNDGVGRFAVEAGFVEVGRAGEVAVDLDAAEAGEGEVLGGDAGGVGDGAGNPCGARLDLCGWHLRGLLRSVGTDAGRPAAQAQIQP